MENSLISWCDNTQNFWIGCTAVSPGCMMCYADTLDRNRFSKTLGGGTKDNPVRHFGKGAPRHRTSASIWLDPFRWNKIAQSGRFVEIRLFEKLLYRGDRREVETHPVKHAAAWAALANPSTLVRTVRPRVFCSSLSDILDPEVDPKMLAEALDVIRQCDGLDWLLLTKRPELWSLRLFAVLEVIENSTSFSRQFVDWVKAWLAGHEPAHIWFGATMEDQPRYDQRVPALRRIPARVRFISMEPMLGPINMFTAAAVGTEANAQDVRSPGQSWVEWVIVGGESGDDIKDADGKVIRSPRPMHPAWARSIRDACALTQTAFHFKQWGEWWAPQTHEDLQRLKTLTVRGSALGQVNLDHPNEHGMWAFRVGKAAAGHLLDGHEHREFPTDPCVVATSEKGSHA